MKSLVPKLWAGGLGPPRAEAGWLVPVFCVGGTGGFCVVGTGVAGAG